MKNIGKAFMLISAAVLITACGSKENGSKRLITDRIEYPVFIKSPYGDDNGDYWKENLETSKRLDFVQTIFDWAYNGKVKTFDYNTNQPLTVDQVKAIGNKTDTVRMARPVPPYDEFDTVIQTKLEFKDIHKIKVLEEWSFNVDHFLLEKKLLGIAPAQTFYGDSTDVIGYKPLFWIYFDEEYIGKLTQKK
jgi:hypothetical protein